MWGWILLVLGEDVARGAREPWEALCLGSPLRVGSYGLPWVRGCVLSPGVFGQCLALWDT